MVKLKHKNLLRKTNNANYQNKPLSTALAMGVVSSYIFTGIIIVLVALMMNYFDMFTGKGQTTLIAILTTIVAVFIGGFKTSKSSKGKGWLWGMLAGVIYITIFYLLIVMTTQTFEVESNLFTRAIVSIGSGTLGGIFGGKKK